MPVLFFFNITWLDISGKPLYVYKLRFLVLLGFESKNNLNDKGKGLQCHLA